MHARCPALVANLWDVTDGEARAMLISTLSPFLAFVRYRLPGSLRVSSVQINRLCTALLEHCTSGGSLLDAVAKARTACRLRFLTGAAAVAYGVPLDFLSREKRKTQK